MASLPKPDCDRSAGAGAGAVVAFSLTSRTGRPKLFDNDQRHAQGQLSPSTRPRKLEGHHHHPTAKKEGKAHHPTTPEEEHLGIVRRTRRERKLESIRRRRRPSRATSRNRRATRPMLSNDGWGAIRTTSEAFLNLFLLHSLAFLPPWAGSYDGESKGVLVRNSWRVHITFKLSAL